MATERELTDAKLEAVEARVDGRLISIEGKLDRLADQLSVGLTQAIDASKRAEVAAGEAKNRAEEARVAAGNTKWNILFTAFAVIAVLAALFTVYTASIDNMTGLFSSITGANQPPQSPPGTATKTQP